MGLVPGFMLAGMFAIWALIHSYFIDKDAAKALKNRKPPTLKEKARSVAEFFSFFGNYSRCLICFVWRCSYTI